MDTVWRGGGYWSCSFCLLGVQWEAKSPVPSVSFKTLIKQVVKLHENLVDILPHTQLQVDWHWVWCLFHYFHFTFLYWCTYIRVGMQSLFAAIEEMFKNRLRIQLQRLGITNNGSTQHGWDWYLCIFRANNEQDVHVRTLDLHGIHPPSLRYTGLSIRSWHTSWVLWAL